MNDVVRPSHAKSKTPRVATADAFTMLVEYYQAPLVRLAYGILHDHDEASDVVQEAFLRAYRNIHAYHAGRSFERWLYAIARNAALDSYRRRRRAAAFAQHYDDAAVALGPEDLAVRDDEATQIHDALGELPDRYRRALELYCVHDLRYREIADALGIPLGTVKTLISRAKRRLRGDQRLRTLAA
jgi:RNA polymerase sigma-70 factor (ECF subfamily)